MNERALLFGQDKSLVGIVTDPDPGVPPLRRGVIILNAGVLHRVGPDRVHVQLARRLAADGFAVLRFDFSGIGDSRRPAGDEPYSQRAAHEASQAMDLLEQSHGVDDFLVFGICAGADVGLQVSSNDPRVAGAVLIDGYNLASLGLVLSFYRSKLLNPRSWFRFLLGRSLTWSALRSITRNTAAQSLSAGTRTALPPPRDFVAQIRALVDRGTELLLVYTDSTPAHYNYRRLLQRRIGDWPSAHRVRVEHMPYSDHVFTLLANRQHVLDTVVDWARTRGEGHSAGRVSPGRTMP